MDIELKLKYFVEWLKSGGKLIPPIIDDLKKIKLDDSNKVIENSITPALYATISLVINRELRKPLFKDKKLSEYSSLIQKEIYFDQIIIDNKSQLEDYLNEDILRPTLYRGVKESKWRLYNSLQRNWILNGYNNSIDEYKTFIKNVLENTRKIHYSVINRFFEINNLSPNNDIAILSFLQHYGGSTPLLDWTYNKDIALYFAIDKIEKNPHSTREIDNYFSLYFLEEKYFKGTSIRKIINKVLQQRQPGVKDGFIKDNLQDGITKEETEMLITDEVLKKMTKILHGNEVTEIACKVDAFFLYNMAYFSDVDNDEDDLIRFKLNNNLNIVNQEGVFIFNNNPILSLEEVGMNLYKKNNPEGDSYKFSKCVNIHKDLKNDVITYLRKKGITRNYIYPNPKTIVKKAFKLSK